MRREERPGTYLRVLHADEDMLVWRRGKVSSAVWVVEQLILLILKTNRPQEVFFFRAGLVQVQESCMDSSVDGFTQTLMSEKTDLE